MHTCIRLYSIYCTMHVCLWLTSRWTVTSVMQKMPSAGARMYHKTSCGPVCVSVLVCVCVCVCVCVYIQRVAKGPEVLRVNGWSPVPLTDSRLITRETHTHTEAGRWGGWRRVRHIGYWKERESGNETERQRLLEFTRCGFFFPFWLHYCTRIHFLTTCQHRAELGCSSVLVLTCTHVYFREKDHNFTPLHLSDGKSYFQDSEWTF